MRQSVFYSSADKGQQYKADSKRYFEEIKFSVRRNVCGVDRHHQKTETGQTWPLHKDKVSQSKGTGKKADSCRGKTAQNPQQGKEGYGIMKLSRYVQETIVNYNVENRPPPSTQGIRQSCANLTCLLLIIPTYTD